MAYIMIRWFQYKLGGDLKYLHIGLDCQLIFSLFFWMIVNLFFFIFFCFSAFANSGNSKNLASVAYKGTSRDLNTFCGNFS